MTEQKVSLRYARAMYEIAESANKVEAVFDDLTQIHNIIFNSRELEVVLKSPVVQKWKKKNLLKALFEPFVSNITFRFIMLLTDKQRENLIVDIAMKYESIYFDKNNIKKVSISTARELDDELKNKVLSSLAIWSGKKIVSDFNIKPELKGGILIRIDDWVYDATIVHQLDMLRQKLISTNNIEINLNN
jgi:F-type H+-transporting ATPase subunit delta